jgi:hypothetical protein
MFVSSGTADSITGPDSWCIEDGITTAGAQRHLISVSSRL